MRELVPRRSRRPPPVALGPGSQVPRGWIQLVVCGHPPPLRLKDTNELETLAPAAFATPLGMHPHLHLSTFSVRSGDRLLFYTDGLLEARDPAGRYFRLDERIQTLRRPGLQSAADELLDRLRAHTRHRLNDDIAMLLVELTLTGPAGEAPAPGHGPRRQNADRRPTGKIAVRVPPPALPDHDPNLRLADAAGPQPGVQRHGDRGSPP
jgi:hypothetical protein